MTKSKTLSLEYCPSCGRLELPGDLVVVSRQSLEKNSSKNLKAPDWRKVTRSPIEGDSEVRDYLLSMQGKITQVQMQKELLKKVGKERTPSKTAISRFFQRNWQNSTGS